MNISASKRALLIGISGTVLQWYDFAIFGYFAPIIAATFFPKQNDVAALLYTFVLFAVGYLLAPVGSLVFGFIGDRYGRKQALSFSILGMTLPTAILGALPGFQSIGLLAPLIVALLRVIQGFVASAEFTGSAIFLIEYAKPGKKALYGCLTSSAYSAGVIIAGLVTSLLSASFMPVWSWRIGFFIALIGGLIIFYLRMRVDETPLYQRITTEEKPKQPFLTALKQAPYAFLGVIGMAWLIGIMTFGTYVFAESYMHQYFHVSITTAILITTLALALDAMLEPLIAMIADKIGHLYVIIIGVVLMLLLSFPIFYLMSSGHICRMIISMLGMSTLIAIAFAPMNAYMIELFPVTCRYSGFGVAFHIGIAFFGGTTPLVIIALVQKTGLLIAPAYYYVWGTIVCLGALALCEYGRRKESLTTDRHLDSTSACQM